VKGCEFARRNQKKRQRDVSDAARIGVDYYGLLERGRWIPNADQLHRIANALNIAPDDVMADVVLHDDTVAVAK
jgi:transcriptional regulator with XRE-family HTH domain